MSPERQRIAIAEACGYRWLPNRFNSQQKILALSTDDANAVGLGESLMKLVPDYLSDLNAMHDAEKLLGASRMQDYARTLLLVLREDDGKFYTMDGSFANIHVSATKRAETFVRIIGKWEESE